MAALYHTRRDLGQFFMLRVDLSATGKVENSLIGNMAKGYT
jgi:hypothetical protein